MQTVRAVALYLTVNTSGTIMTKKLEKLNNIIISPWNQQTVFLAV